MTTGTTTAKTAMTTRPSVGIPRGRYISSIQMFQIIHNKGKTFSNGGVGVALPKEVHAKYAVASEEPQIDENGTTIPSTLNLYLWIEEAMYLHDAGLADFVQQQEEGEKEAIVLTTQQLFEIMLSSEEGISLPMYRVYAHLRLQSFRVLRYAGVSAKLENSSSKKEDDGDVSSLPIEKQQQQQSAWRKRISQAPPPQIWRHNNDGDDSNPAILAWQVYEPNAQFRKTNPGPPSFYVTVCHFAERSPNVTDFYDLLSKQEEDIPIKVAAVADSGTVILFGLTNFGVPSIA